MPLTGTVWQCSGTELGTNKKERAGGPLPTIDPREYPNGISEFGCRMYTRTAVSGARGGAPRTFAGAAYRLRNVK